MKQSQEPNRRRRRKIRKSAGTPPPSETESPAEAERPSHLKSKPRSVTPSLSLLSPPLRSAPHFVRFSGLRSQALNLAGDLGEEPLPLPILRQLLLLLLLRHEQLPRLRGHRPRQALGNPPPPTSSASVGFAPPTPASDPPVSVRPRLECERFLIVSLFFFSGYGCGGGEDGVQGAEEENHRVLRRQERRQVAALQGPQ